MSCPTLIIDGITAPLQSLLRFDQEYNDLAAQTFNRVASGDGVLRLGWQGKIETVINASGWVSDPFANLLYGQSVLIQCAMPRAASSATNVVEVPAGRRSDGIHAPAGFALVDGILQETNIDSWATNTATLATVAGAVGYRVQYFPEFTGVVTLKDSTNNNDGTFRWRLEAEEI